jgi:hypothetical protein
MSHAATSRREFLLGASAVLPAASALAQALTNAPDRAPDEKLPPLRAITRGFYLGTLSALAASLVVGLAIGLARAGRAGHRVGPGADRVGRGGGKPNSCIREISNKRGSPGAFSPTTRRRARKRRFPKWSFPKCVIA